MQLISHENALPFHDAKRYRKCETSCSSIMILLLVQLSLTGLEKLMKIYTLLRVRCLKKIRYYGLLYDYIILADRTNGRTYATVLRPSSSVCLSSVTLCIVAKRCVLEQKLLLRAYRKSYMRNRLVPN